MDAKSVLTKNALIVRYEAGYDEEKQEIVYKQAKFSKIKLNVTDEATLATGNAIANLLDCEGNFQVKKEELYIVGEA